MNRGAGDAAAQRLLLAAAAGATVAAGWLAAAAPSIVAGLMAGTVGVAMASQWAGGVVGMNELPNLVIAGLGHNPFPSSAVRIMTIGLFGAATGAALIRGRVPARILLGGPVVSSLALGIYMAVHITTNSGASYGGFKAAAFVATDLVAIVAAAVVGWQARETQRFFTVYVAIATIAGGVVLHGLLSHSIAPTVAARFSLSAEEYPIELGRQCAFGLVIAAAAVLYSRNRRIRLGAAALILPLAGGLLASGSRGPVMACLAGGSALAFPGIRRPSMRKAVLASGAGVVPVAVIAGLLVPQATVARALQAVADLGGSSNGRSMLWHLAWQAFERHPILGLGTGGFAGLDPALLYPHDLPLEIAAELGLVGLACALFLFASALRAAYAAAKQSADIQLWTTVALVVVALTNGFVSGDLRTNADVWLMVGLMYGVSQRVAAGRGAGA